MIFKLNLLGGLDGDCCLMNFKLNLLGGLDGDCCRRRRRCVAAQTVSVELLVWPGQVQ